MNLSPTIVPLLSFYKNGFYLLLLTNVDKLLKERKQIYSITIQLNFSNSLH